LVEAKLKKEDFDSFQKGAIFCLPMFADNFAQVCWELKKTLERIRNDLRRWANMGKG